MSGIGKVIQLMRRGKVSKIKFALNHMVAPQLDLPAFLALTRQLGLDAVELRNV